MGPAAATDSSQNEHNKIDRDYRCSYNHHVLAMSILDCIISLHIPTTKYRILQMCAIANQSQIVYQLARTTPYLKPVRYIHVYYRG